MTNFINRYFDAGIDTPAAPPVNPAELMAKQGVRTDLDTRADQIPDIKTDQPAAAITESPAQPAPAPAVAEPSAAPATPPVETPKPAATTETPKPQDQAADWKKTLKQIPETDILKELGYDDKLVGLLNRWKTGGSITEYLEAASVDYSTMNAEEVMKRHMKQSYPELSKEDFEELYRMNVTEHYKLDPDMFTEQEVRRGNILLNAEAKAVRQKLTESQQQYLISKAPEQTGPTAEEQEKEQQRLQSEFLSEYKKTIEAHPYVVDIVKNKAISFGEGEERFNFTTEDPGKLLNLLYDSALWQSKMRNADGSLNIEKQILLAAIADDDKSLINELAKHYKAMGAKRTVEQIENAVPPGGTPARPDVPELNPAAALAKNGVLVSGS